MYINIYYYKVIITYNMAIFQLLFITTMVDPEW